MMSEKRYLRGRVTVKVGDITVEHVDAIVNAANSQLLGGGGVDGAIHRAGGPAILAECRAIRARSHPNGLPVGEAVITTAGDMPAKYVIHTVGPIYGRNGGRDAELLTNAYRNSIRIAAENGLISIAFPAISTGVYGYPKADAARVASDALRASLGEHPSIADVWLAFFSPGDADIFNKHCTLEA